jgi:uroporphyrin-III C-methyltransferase
MAADTAVIYMGLGEAERIASTLIARGMSASKPVVVVENASLPQHREFKLRLCDLPRLASLGLEGPAVIFIGDSYSDASADSLGAVPHARYA